MRENFRARGSMIDLKTFFFWCKKQPVVVSFYSAKNKRKKKPCDLSLSLRRKSSREKEEEHALQILTKRALVEQTSRGKSPAR